MKTIIGTKGNSPRVNTNNIFFLTPLESKKFDLIKFLKKAIALDEIINDPTLNLNDSQKLEINSMIGKIKNDYKDMLRDSYRVIFIPQKDGFKEEDLGSPIYGDSKAINEEVFEHLLNKGEILRRIAPIVLENKFLKNNDYVKILQIYKSSLKTKGETRFLDINVLLDSVKEGIRNKLFGLAFDRNNEIECIDTESAIINEEYYIVNKDYYNEHFKYKKEPIIKEPQPEDYGGSQTNGGETPTVPNNGEEDEPPRPPTTKTIKNLNLTFKIPKGKALEIGRMINLLHTYFEHIDITIKTSSGEISENDYEMKIKETLLQLGINIEEKQISNFK